MEAEEDSGLNSLFPLLPFVDKVRLVGGFPYKVNLDKRPILTKDRHFYPKVLLVGAAFAAGPVLCMGLACEQYHCLRDIGGMAAAMGLERMDLAIFNCNLWAGVAAAVPYLYFYLARQACIMLPTKVKGKLFPLHV